MEHEPKPEPRNREQLIEKLASLGHYETGEQEENRASAELVVDAVLRAAERGIELDDGFVELSAEMLHKEWVKRNESRATEELKRVYDDLPEEEKEKDRVFVRRAIMLYENLPGLE